ncbi:MAG TPA: UMP kinase [Methanomassiliicoccales archaeon]|nr:UMP kinase [Methanomassiliicoccales archaeon]
MDCVVVSLGGSILIPGERDAENFSAIAGLMRSLSKELHLVLICGGGKVARYYISTGRELGAAQDRLDEMGIEATRLNARLLQIALGRDACDCLPRTVEEAVKEGRKGKILVMGGTSPGHTTDAVAAMVALRLGAKRIVNATSVDAAYSTDPNKHRDAVRYSRLTHKQLYELVDKGLHSAGPSDVFDRAGAEVAMRANIPIFIVNGRDHEELRAAIRGEKIKGTVVAD